MLDVVSGIIAVSFVAYWIDNHEWHINNFITFCIAIELTKQLRITSYKLAVKVMLFFTIVDLFWSLIAKYIYPSYLNLSMNGKAHLNFFKLEVPVFFGERAYFCQSLTVQVTILPILFLTFLEKFGQRIGTTAYVKWGILFYLVGLVSGTYMSTYFAFPQPVLLYVCPFMILGPLYVAKIRGEDNLMLKEGILNNPIAEEFVTKLLKKFRDPAN